MNSLLPNHQFKVLADIQKCWVERAADGTETRWVGGVASGTNLDLEGERMAQSAIVAFKRAIDDGIVDPVTKEWSYVPFRSEHDRGWDRLLGWVREAEIDEGHNLWIKAELNNNSAADDLWRNLNREPEVGKPIRLGLSIAGTVVKAGKEWVAELGRWVKTFYEIALSEISTVGSPANPITYVDALAKSVSWDKLGDPIVVAEGAETREETKMEDQVLTAEQAEKAADAAAAEPSAVETAAEAAKSEGQVVETDATSQEASDTDGATEKGEETATDDVAKQLSAFTAGILEAVGALTREINSMAYQIQLLVADHQMVEDAVAYSAEGGEPDVAKQDDQPAADAKKAEEAEEPEALKALQAEIETQNGAIETQKGEIATLKAEIEALKAQPVAKGIAVTKDKVEELEGAEGNPVAKFRAEAANLTGRQILLAALQPAA